MTSIESRGGVDSDCVLLSKQDLRMGKNSLRFEFSSSSSSTTAATADAAASGGGSSSSVTAAVTDGDAHGAAAGGGSDNAAAATSWPIPPHVFVCLLWRWPDLKLHFDAESRRLEQMEEEEEKRSLLGGCRCGDVTMTSSSTKKGLRDDDVDEASDAGARKPSLKASPSLTKSGVCVCGADDRRNSSATFPMTFPRSSYDLRQLPVCRTRSTSHVCVNPYHWARLYEPGEWVQCLYRKSVRVRDWYRIKSTGNPRLSAN